MATEVAKASAIAKQRDVVLAPVRAYTEYWATPIQKNPDTLSRDDKQALVQRVVDIAVKNKEVVSVNASVGIEHEWKYFASSEGSYIEQDVWSASPSFTVTARKNNETRSRTYTGEMMTGGWEIAERAQMPENAERIAAEAVEFCTAKPVEMGVKDVVMTPSHAMLTIHEIVGHATELDRILGYEANYAGTSFIKICRPQQAEVRLEAVQRHRRSHHARRRRHGRLRRRRREDAAVAARARRDPRRAADQPRDGASHRREREPRLHLGELVARLSVPAHAERPRRCRGRPGSPTPEQIIADTKDGVLIDGRGSYSIDQQRYNGQFGGNAFWEIKNGKITRMVSNVTYNAITTDFWGNLDAISGKESWKMFGTGGDAKGQPTQTNSITHGSPYLRIRKIMIGAAYA